MNYNKTTIPESVQKEIEAQRTAELKKLAPMKELGGIKVASAKELSTTHFEELTFLYLDILVRPNLALLAGAPKSGKSWCALMMSLDVARQGHEVLYIANEDNYRRLKGRLNEQKLQPFEEPPETLKFFSGLSSEKPVPRGEEAITWLEGYICSKTKPKLIVVDTIEAFREPAKTEKGYDVAVSEFAVWRKFAHKHNITMLAVHHTKKNIDPAYNPIESILGSQGIAATVETILVLRQVPGSQDATLFVTGKDIEHRDDLLLRWKNPGFESPENATEARLGTFQKIVLKYIAENPACTQTSICKVTRKSKSQVSEAVSRLVESGLVMRREYGKLIRSPHKPANSANLDN